MLIQWEACLNENSRHQKVPRADAHPLLGAVAFTVVPSRLTVGAAVPRGLRFLESSPEQPFLSTLRNQSMSHLQRNKANYVNKDITPARQQ